MELKRVLGKDNRQAMEQVVRLYGPDALVVSGHQVRNQFELVVAVDIEPDLSLLDVPDDELHLDAPVPAHAKAVKPVEKTGFRTALLGDESISETRHTDALRAEEIVALFRDEIQILKREIQETRKASAWHMQMSRPDGLTPWQQGLMDHAIPSRLKTLLVDALAEIEDAEEAEARLHAVLMEGLETVSEDPAHISGVHAFFGSTGAGKTTVVGKLARQAAETYGGNQVAIISYADQKLGAWNQLQLMAAQWDVTCYRANGPEMLNTLLRELTDKACVLIDTSGVDIANHYADLTAHAPEALMHLVVSTETSRASVKKLLLDTLTWDSVNVSKLDESTDSWVLIDGLLQAPDCQLWLGSASGQLNKPVAQLNAHKWVAAVISTIELPHTAETESPSAEHDGRQTLEGVSTLDFLTGLRATKNDRHANLTAKTESMQTGR